MSDSMSVLPEIADRGYAHPETLVTTAWVADHLNDSDLRLVEVDVDTSAYDSGHIPGAVGWNWQTELMDTVRRDIISKQAFENLLGESGISNDDTIILYGDNNNWFAAYAFWELKYYGHEKLRLMDGGRAKWEAEDRGLTTDKPNPKKESYKIGAVLEELRAFRGDVYRAIEVDHPLVDVRSPDEFTGKILAPPGLSETAQRGGHIPGARSIPWSKAVAEDGTFRNQVDLERLYAKENNVSGDREVIAYCRIGERSSHSWFVLKYLLGYNDVKNYDGSWTEWGNLVGAPIEKGS